MRSIMAIAALAAGLAVGQEAAKLLPVREWPRVIQLGGKQVVNPAPADCVKAGYRLIPTKPTTPVGKRIVSERFEQDSNNAALVKWIIEYADIPAPPPPPEPEPTTNVVADKVRFAFGAKSGRFIGATWVDAPKTNAVSK